MSGGPGGGGVEVKIGEGRLARQEAPHCSMGTRADGCLLRAILGPLGQGGRILFLCGGQGWAAGRAVW